MKRWTGLLVSALVIASALTACSDGDSESGKPKISAAWLKTVDSEYRAAGSPTSDIPVIDVEESCALDITVKVDGKKAKSDGAGASGLADDGRRYICRFADPASIMVVVGKYPSANNAQAEVDHILDGENTTDTTVDGARIVTMEDQLGDSVEYTALHADGKAFASLEMTPYQELTSWNSAKTARLLVDILRSS